MTHRISAIHFWPLTVRNRTPDARTPPDRSNQALFFLNDSFVHAKAEEFAAGLAGLNADEAQQVESAYRLALGRLPSEMERAEASEFLASYKSELLAANKDNIAGTALAALARALFGSNEFLHLD
jgi:hypothetical protein